MHFSTTEHSSAKKQVLAYNILNRLDVGRLAEAQHLNNNGI